MPHIFRFHKGHNTNIYDWTPSDRIQPSDVREVMDKTNILTSSAGTSIPTPIARMFLFKTAFEILAAQVRDNQVAEKSIYSGLVSETLDLLEMLYKSGSDENKFRYQKWIFDNSQQDNNVILNHFGIDQGHRLLAESFKQAASQAPFNNKIEITLIYYREGNKEILVGGTSPFTFVFTSPNFKRKMLERGFRAISGLVSNDILFDADYKQLHERDSAFIKYIEDLSGTEGINQSFSGFTEYVINTRNRNQNCFNGEIGVMQDIQFNDTPLIVSNIHLKQLSPEDYKRNINAHSDFKLALPEDSEYVNEPLRPLFLLDKMSYDGQYTSQNNRWNPNTKVSENLYPETTLHDIQGRELPGLDGIHYPFLSSFDFLESNLIRLPGYMLNDERFLCLTNNQTFIYPIKPIFFHFFPINRIKEYVSVEVKNEQVTIVLKIPVFGKIGKRDFVCRKTYDKESTINYGGILGIFPFTKAINENLFHINKYTVASYEKINSESKIESIKFYKKNGIQPVRTLPVKRSEYDELKTKSTYYQLDESFNIIQLSFVKDNSNCSGVIIPLFKEIENGTESYVYAIDFGTSNTHIEYGRIVNGQVTQTAPFTIEEDTMQMSLLNKPISISKNDGADKYNDYESRLAMGDFAEAKTITLREFIPFQIGNHMSASIRFPFRTATCESNNFISNHNNKNLFLDANIGFHIDEDALVDNIRYKTDLKWLLEKDKNDQFNVNRISIYFRELLLMIRTKVLMEKNNLRGDLTKIKVAFSFPNSMVPSLKDTLLDLLKREYLSVFGPNAEKIIEVTESIAPYYQLKYDNVNIQNDSFCNIDIGGGTTDIVLIDKDPGNINILNCFCSSFKFAGKQLWGSGSNEFNLTDNGFVDYYRHFIQRIDPILYSELSKILNSKTNRTEDVVGFLFSKPEYKFANIFTDCEDLKVVPLIHYSAILFYITKLAKLVNVELPRTVSFSGKGSEYLSIIFPSDNDLKGYTRKVLSIFSGKPTRSDFGIERSKEPKVITAKGSTHYANNPTKNNDDDWGNDDQNLKNEKILKQIKINYNGLTSLNINDNPITYKDFTDDLKNDVLTNLSEFFDLLFDNIELSKIIKDKLNIKDFASYKLDFIPAEGKIVEVGKLRDSFKATCANLNESDDLNDSPFFFALNYSLIALSREITLKALQK